MRILWLTWKDKTHPLAGGAEVISSELAKRLVQHGHEVILLVGNYKGANRHDTIDGYRVIRVGNRVTVYLAAFFYARKHLRDWPDLVIEEVNTIPFLSRTYYRSKRRILFFHMLCRQIWFYELPKLLGLLGYMLEPLYLRMLAGDRAIAMSNSTKQDMIRNGFQASKVTVISEAIQLEPLPSIDGLKKAEQPTMISLGSMRPMKRTLDQVRAFEIAKRSIPNLQFRLAGDSSGAYGRKVQQAVKTSKYTADITYLGRISAKQKVAELQLAHVIAVTSVKEGWGLIVTEAASQGTPAVVYDVDGLRDSVRHDETGRICQQNTPENLAKNIVELLGDPTKYRTFQYSAWEWSKDINFENSYNQFAKEIAA